MRLSWLANERQSSIYLHLCGIKILLAAPDFPRNQDPNQVLILYGKHLTNKDMCLAPQCPFSQVLFSFPVIASILAQTIQYKRNLTTDVIHSLSAIIGLHEAMSVWK